MTDRVWMMVCLLIGAAALWFLHDWLRAPYALDDSYQYLDAAANIASGECVCTRLAHFDEQVASRMPVPFTHFPPGYPLLIAAMSRLGMSPEVAGYVLSVCGFLATIWLMWDIGVALGARAWILTAVSLLWIGNADALTYGSMVATEAAFTAALMAIVALMVRDLRAGGKRPALLLAIGMLAGLSYWLRYAGLFLIPVAALYIAWRGWRDRETLPWAAGGLILAATLTAALQIRNIVYTGSWKGGFTTGEGDSLYMVVIETIKGFYHVVFGDRVVAHFDVWTVVFLVSLLAVLFVTAQGWRRERLEAVWDFRSAAGVWIGLVGLAYVGGIMLTALLSIAGHTSRYLSPIYPLLLVSLAAVQPVASSPKQYVAITALAMAVMAIHSRSLLTRPILAPHVVASEALDQEVQRDTSVRQWLRNRVTPAGVIVSVNGQAAQYVLQRPVISVIVPEHSARQTDEAGFHSLMAQHGARYLLLFPDTPAFYRRDQDAIPFLRNLAAGHAPPLWLTPALRTQNAVVYECSSCVR